MDIEDIFLDPWVLKALSPKEVMADISLGEGWRVEALGDGSHAGQGFVLREYRADGSLTRRVIRWHPGGGHHGPEPYWRVSSPSGGKSDPIR